MGLITILMALAMERYWAASRQWRSWEVLTRYWQWMVPKAQRFPWGWAQLALLLLPLPLLAWLVGCLLCWSGGIGGLLWFVWRLLVLWFCIAPARLWLAVRGFAKGETLKSLGVAGNASAQSVAEAVWMEAYEGLFAVLFWFLLLGPFGALLYRLTSLLMRRVSQEEEPVLYQHVWRWRVLIDWLPARLTALCFTLVGQFMTGFGHWWQGVLDWTRDARQLLGECGQAALGEVSDKSKVARALAALALVERSLLVWLVLIALLTITAWLQ